MYIAELYSFITVFFGTRNDVSQNTLIHFAATVSS